MYVYIKLQIFLFLSEALSMLKNIIGLLVQKKKIICTFTFKEIMRLQYLYKQIRLRDHREITCYA